MTVYERKEGRWQIHNIQIFEIPQLPTPIRVPIETLRAYCGTYSIDPSTHYEVFLRGDSLFGRIKGRKEEALLPETSTVFFRNSDTRGRRLFVMDAGGQWLMLARRNGQDLIWKKD